MDNNLSSVHTAAEIADMLLTIDDIQMILRTAPFDEDTARQKVYETNAKHPDNKMIWNMQMFLLVFQFNKRQKKTCIKIYSGKHIISKRKSLESLLMKCERNGKIGETGISIR